jgi:hypothetical protein
LRRAAPADPVVAPNVFLICQSKSEHIIRDDEIADVDGRTLTMRSENRRFFSLGELNDAGPIFSASRNKRAGVHPA